MKQLILSLLLLPVFFNSQAQEYPKAILAGDYPDPTIIRDGEDYYMTHSPFYYMPGFLIWHSKDLVNWKPLSRIIPTYQGSAMAPDLVKHKGRFFLYFPSAGTNWVAWADHIEGPWSAPVDLKVSGIDPGHVIGEDGKRYLFVDKGYVIGLSEDGLSTIGERKKVYDGWKYPKNWKTEGTQMYLESPKLNYKNGFFYMSSAEGGTAGPATSHMVVAARSKSVMGPWENSPYNPIVHTYSEDENWWSKGHGTLIDDVNGNWWIIYHAYAKGYHTLGRQTLIEPIEWTADGWFKSKKDAKPIVSSDTTEHGLTLSDTFSGSQLGLQWTFWKEYAPEKISLNKNTLTVAGKGESVANARKLLVTPTDKNYQAQVEVFVQKGNQAGLVLYYNEKAFAGIISDGKKFTLYSDATKSRTIDNTFGNHFFLRILNQGNRCVFYASPDGQDWTVLERNVDVSYMHHNTYLGFYALRPALVSQGKAAAQFLDFRYKDAVPGVKDMAEYLMVFHKDETHGLHMALSTDGKVFTALNGGKPVVSADTIASQKGIRDPQIYRGPDGAFYVSMTDLHISAKDAGYRSTAWERDGSKYGWGNNKGIVLMKSWDLINWKHTAIAFDKLSAAFAEVGCVWAPQVIFDEVKQKLMLYFTMRFQNEAAKLYYVYVNEDFDRLEGMPQILFEYPDKNVTAIDADIVKVGDKFHLFYVAHDGQSGIKKAISDHINRDYFFDARWYDPETYKCEAPSVWKRIGKQKWVLMYDIFGITPNNFGFSETSDFVNFTNLGRFNEGVMKATNFLPKHGAVVHLTKLEAENLRSFLGQSSEKAVGK